MANHPLRTRPPLPSMKRRSGVRRVVTPTRSRTPNPLASLGPSQAGSLEGDVAPVQAQAEAVAVPRRKSGTMPAPATERASRPREPMPTVPTPEALEVQLLEELKRHDEAAWNDAPLIEISSEPAARAANDSVPALEILHKAAPSLDFELKMDAASGDRKDNLAGIVDACELSSVAKAQATRQPVEALRVPTVRSGPDAPPRSSRAPEAIQPSVIVTDESSFGGVEVRTPQLDLPRDEMPTQPSDDWQLDDWRAEHERQVPTIPPARRSQQPKRRRWPTAVTALFLAGAAAGYFGFPEQYAQAWRATSSHAKIWGGALQLKLVEKGWL